MPKTGIFENWTWKLPLPAPFNSLISNVSTTYYSKYCTVSTKKSTLHAPCLHAILEYMEMDMSVTGNTTSQSAIGTQGDKIIAEYKTHMREIHVVIFNRVNGKFSAGRFDHPDSSPQIYTVKESGNTGSALFFALMPIALEEEEFQNYYNKLVSCRNDAYANLKLASEAAFILCDNLYRRIETANVVGDNGILISIPGTKNIPQLTALNLKRGVYIPTQVLFGTFQILVPQSSESIEIKNEDFCAKYSFSERTFREKEKGMIPELESWYVIPEEVVTICKHIQATTTANQPIRNIMLRGEAGTGKTESAKAIATGLGLPYLFYTCSSNTEIYDLVGQMLPVTNKKENGIREYPSLEDIQMDCSSAYCKLTGIYDETVEEEEVFSELIKAIEKNVRAENTKEPQFEYIESPLITAIKNGYVIEVQEPTVISNPGVLVGLNGLLDRCASITLPTGEKICRHPDTVVIITTNHNYAGCKNLNQSVISRMNVILDIEQPNLDTVIERVMKITGCTETENVTKMARCIEEIKEHCNEVMINDGSCGVRELINWVQSYMVCGSIMQAARYTILSSVSAEKENRAEILSTCLEPLFKEEK